MNFLVGQSGGPTAVINASLAGVYEAARRQGGRVLGMEHGVEGLLKGQVTDLGRLLEGRLPLELLRRTPASYLGSCRYKLPDPEEGAEVYEALFEQFARFEVGAVLYIGGNDSMDTIAKLAAYGRAAGSPIRFVGVPKTIDNDLECTDHSPGYGSAAKYIATVVKEIIRDSGVYDLPSVTVAEIMGRHAGWLAAAASLAKGDDCEGPDMILLPEVPFDPGMFLKRVARLQNQKKTIVIAASEGVRDRQGRFLCEAAGGSEQLDAFGHLAALSGAGRYLAGLVSRELGCKSRAIELSTLQRCAGHLVSRTDADEAWRVGGAAVAAALEGRTGCMIALRRLAGQPYLCAAEPVEVTKVANGEKTVPLEWIAPDGMQVNAAFEAYARPLIQGELTPVFVDGVPRHLTL